MSKIIYLVLLIISITPIRVLNYIARIIQCINKHTIRYRINVIKKNIHLAFPMMRKNDITNLTNKFYQYFFTTIMEIIKSIRWNEHQIKSKVKIKNIAMINKSLKKGQHIVLLSAHYSNWELLLLRLSLIPKI